jgi:branched-chain amino acid transport system substrate-binding protein
MTGWHFHRIRKFTAAVAIALTALMAFTACGTSSTQTGNTSPILIGTSLSTSGDFADDGKAFQQGYELWADQVNKSGGLLGRKVKLDIVADNSTPEQVTTNYTKLITVDHVDFTIGPYSSLLTKPASVVTNRYGYAMLEGAGGAPSVFNRGIKGIYDVSVPVENLLVSYGQMLAAMPADQRPKTVAYATEDDPFTQPQIDKVKPILEAAGIKTVYYQVFPSECSSEGHTFRTPRRSSRSSHSSITTPRPSCSQPGQMLARLLFRRSARRTLKALPSPIAGGQS